MLKCRDVEQRADALVDNEPLHWRERMALRLHLLICHHCRRYVRQLRQLVASLRRPPAPASPEQVDRIMRRIPEPAEEGTSDPS